MSESNSSTVTVYGLSSSKDGAIRYVGQTTRSLSTRLKWHITWAEKKRDKSRRTAWIRSVLASGFALNIEILEADAVKHKAEIRWISDLLARGSDLVNGTLGGDQCIGVPKTESHRRAISEAHKGSKKPWTAERNARRKGMPGHAASAETRAKISAATTGKPKAGLSERNRSRVWTDDARAKISAANRKISHGDIREIKRLLASGMLQTAIASRYGVSNSLVSQIKRGVRHKDV